MNKCKGCGVILQSDNFNEDGYLSKNNDLCERCFRIRHYNEYKRVIKNNNYFFSILDNIKETNDLTLVVIDLLNINNELIQLKKHLSNNIILVLTKRDVLPKDIYDQKLLDYIDRFNISYIDKIIVSSKKNYNIDSLYEMINKYKNNNNVYVVGFTNAGKSTLINKLIYNYSNLNTEITTSMLPSTTMDTIEIKLNDNLMLIDTPGLLDKGNILDYIDSSIIKKLVLKKEIKPITYQIKTHQSIFIDSIIRIDVLPYIDLTFFIPNNLEITRLYKDTDKLKKLDKRILDILPNEDIVIKGLGFIKANQKSSITIYCDGNIDIYLRDSLI